MRRWRIVGAVVVVVAGAGWLYRSWAHTRGIRQPIAFNHRAHVTNAAIECSECHAYFKETRRSGLPDASVCMSCHSDALTASAEEAKLRRLSEEKQPIVFRKLFQLPDHVYYSHRRHVVSGKLQCEQCHGLIASTDAPPLRPMVSVTMDFCIDCHSKSKVTNDCKACHR